MNHRLRFLAATALTSALVLPLILNSGSLVLAQSQEAPAAPVAPADEEANTAQGQPDVSPELIAKLEKALTGTTWTGQFTIDGGQGPPSPESYVIGEVSHEGGNNWVCLLYTSPSPRDRG